MSLRSTLGTAVGIAGGVGLIGYATYWLWDRASDGPGWGLGGGGGDGSSILGWGGPKGPAADEGGDGGKAPEGSSGGSGGDRPGGSDPGGGGTSGADSAGGGSGSSGGGGTGGTDNDGDGTGGSGGGGLGGGSGGGVGSGEGQGSSNDPDQGQGGKGEDEGGGASGEQYDGWGGQVIVQDLAPPDVSAAKLAQVRATIVDLVGGAVLDPGQSAPTLPGPLHTFNPEHGGLLLFWADVCLHYNYDLPPGRLDSANPSHLPWVNLWLDILALVALEEEKMNAGTELDDTPNEPKAFVHVGIGTLSIAYSSLDTSRIEERGRHTPRDPLARLIGRRYANV